MKEYVLPAIAAVFVVSLVILTQDPTGYIVGENIIIPPAQSVEITGEEHEAEIFESSVYAFLQSSENIEYELYKTTDSEKRVFDNYDRELIEYGYTLSEDYSGTYLYQDITISYFSYTKGMSAVVYATCVFNGYTYILYTTGNVLDYKALLDNIN